MIIERRLPEKRRTGLALAIGVFDGLHLGHREIIVALKKRAKAGGWPAGVLTFERHPVALLAPHKQPPQLKGLERKIELLDEAGVDRVWLLKFDRAFAGVSAEKFIRDVLVKKLAVKSLVVGSDFCFGKGGKGNVALLKSEGKKLGFSVCEVKSARVGRAIVSSTVIRKAVAAGNMKLAAKLLGRPFRLFGKVVSGRGLGKTLERPTANLALEPALLPKAGVWGGRARIKGQAPWRKFIANLGKRPTVEKNGELRLELHFLSNPGRVKGRRLEVELTEFLRAERKFKSLDALKTQITKDELKFRRLRK